MSIKSSATNERRVNRKEVRDSQRFPRNLTPLIIDIMAKNREKHGGDILSESCY